MKLLAQLHGTDAETGKVVRIGEDATERQHGDEAGALPATPVGAIDEVEHVSEAAYRQRLLVHGGPPYCFRGAV
jgi:hypothetical protein